MFIRVLSLRDRIQTQMSLYKKRILQKASREALKNQGLEREQLTAILPGPASLAQWSTVTAHPTQASTSLTKTRYSWDFSECSPCILSVPMNVTKDERHSQELNLSPLCTSWEMEWNLLPEDRKKNTNPVLPGGTFFVIVILLSFFACIIHLIYIICPFLCAVKLRCKDQMVRLRYLAS